MVMVEETLGKPHILPQPFAYSIDTRSTSSVSSETTRAKIIKVDMGEAQMMTSGDVKFLRDIAKEIEPKITEIESTIASHLPKP